VSLCRTYRFYLQPTHRQRIALSRLLDVQRELYNAALDERRGAWRCEHRSVSYIDQCRTLTEVRETNPETLEFGVVVCRGTLKRLDRAFMAFYGRCDRGETPGYPRFRSKTRFDSAQWEDTQSWRFKELERRLYLQGVGHVRVRNHRPTRGIAKAITVKREGRRWYVSIRCTNVPRVELPKTGRDIGIDLGIVALVATSDGELVDNPRQLTHSQKGLATAQSRLAAMNCGSTRAHRAAEQIANAHRRIRNQRVDLAHKLSRRLVDSNDMIVMERLRPDQMARRPKPKIGASGEFAPNGRRAKAGLNRSIYDAGWARLSSMIAYKAESAGRCHVLVEAAHTSQRCAECGHIARENRRSQAVFRCRQCGHEDNADVNAARNILWAGRAQRASAREVGT
jgi:putative transposase